MNCPACQADNIGGADQCVECGTDLQHLDAPDGAIPLLTSVMTDPIAELIPHDPLRVAPETPVSEVIRKLVDTGRNCALVVSEANAILGIFTERDILLRVADDYPQRSGRPVSEFMTADPERLRPEHTIAFGLNRMTVGDYRHVPIEKDGQALGVVSVRHILGYLVSRYPDLLAETRA